MELVAAVVGPIVGGMISVVIWLNKKNSEHIESGFNRLNTTLNVVERKVDDFRVDVAKNYVTNEDLVIHIKGEDQWHLEMKNQISEVKTEIRDLRNAMDRFYLDGK